MDLGEPVPRRGPRRVRGLARGQRSRQGHEGRRRARAHHWAARLGHVERGEVAVSGVADEKPSLPQSRRPHLRGSRRGVGVFPLTRRLSRDRIRRSRRRRRPGRRSQSPEHARADASQRRPRGTGRGAPRRGRPQHPGDRSSGQTAGRWWYRHAGTVSGQANHCGRTLPLGFRDARVLRGGDLGRGDAARGDLAEGWGDTDLGCCEPPVRGP